MNFHLKVDLEVYLIVCQVKLMQLGELTKKLEADVPRSA